MQQTDDLTWRTKGNADEWKWDEAVLFQNDYLKESDFWPPLHWALSPYLENEKIQKTIIGSKIQF